MKLPHFKLCVLPSTSSCSPWQQARSHKEDKEYPHCQSASSCNKKKIVVITTILVLLHVVVEMVMMMITFIMIMMTVS